mmetsp:Transcript_53421/g.121900  ORF Transcript_53421/g.121900 Transcript_53421/m.121900 type:complete len:94 (+) Transcript_53421:111-392(+)
MDVSNASTDIATGIAMNNTMPWITPDIVTRANDGVESMVDVVRVTEVAAVEAVQLTKKVIEDVAVMAEIADKIRTKTKLRSGCGMRQKEEIAD